MCAWCSDLLVCCRSLWSPKGSEWYRLYHEEDEEEGGDKGREFGNEGERGVESAKKSGVKSEPAGYADEQGGDSVFD